MKARVRTDPSNYHPSYVIATLQINSIVLGIIICFFIFPFLYIVLYIRCSFAFHLRHIIIIIQRESFFYPNPDRVRALYLSIYIFNSCTFNVIYLFVFVDVPATRRK